MTRQNLIVATRASRLALAQTRTVVEALGAAHPDLVIETREMTTTGDRRRDVPPAAVGGKGLFTRELETALLAGEVDLAVHSLKDLPTELPEGLALAAVPAREDPLDALVLREPAEAEADDPLRLLPPGARVGTSSLRRSAFLRHRRPDLDIQPLRGNLDTRLRRLDDGNYDALVLAAAGLRRLRLGERIAATLPAEVCLPAPGQGALGVEARAGDERVAELLAAIEDAGARDAVTAERAWLAAVGGGCQVPCGALARLEGDGLVLIAAVASCDGTVLVKREGVMPRTRAEELGRRLADSMLEDGADRLLERPA